MESWHAEKWQVHEMLIWQVDRTNKLTKGHIYKMECYKMIK